MIRKLSPRLSIPVTAFFLLLFGLLVYAGPSGQDAAFFRLETENNHSVIRFHLPEGWRIKVLNPSPAVKILIKLINTVSDETPGVKIENSLPSSAGVRSYRILPLTSSSALLVLELAGKMDFRWEGKNGGGLIIYDENFRDPSQREYLRGVQLHRQGKLREALSAYRKAVFLNRRNGNAYYKAGQIRFAFKQYRLAEINYNHALRLKCDSLGLYPAMARLYQIQGRKRLAEKYQRLYREKQQQVLSQPAEKQENISLNPATPPITAEKQKEVQTTPTPPAGEQRAVSAPAREAEPLLPMRIVLYLFGIVLLSVFLIISGFVYFRKKRYPRQVGREELLLSLDSQKLTARKEEILHLARKAAADRPADDKTENEGLMEEENVPSSQVTEEFVGRDEKEHSNLSVEEDTVPDRADVARLLNLGVGEIELALNLTVHQRQAQKKRTLESEIEEMYERNISVTEIARRMHLGQGEVELLLALRKKKVAYGSV